MTTHDTLTPALVEEIRAKSATIREVITQANPSFQAQDALAKHLAANLRDAISGGPDVAIEWGRALVAAASCAAALANAINKRKNVNPTDVPAILLNVLGWAGIDLMDGTS